MSKVFLRYNSMSQTKSKSDSMYAKREKNNKKKRKKCAMLCCVFVCVCLSVGSLKTPLPQLMARSRLSTSHTITAIIFIIILASIQQPRVLNQLQLEVSHKQDELLMLLDNRLNFGGKIIKTSIQMQE